MSSNSPSEAAAPSEAMEVDSVDSVVASGGKVGPKDADGSGVCDADGGNIRVQESTQSEREAECDLASAAPDPASSPPPSSSSSSSSSSSPPPSSSLSSSTTAVAPVTTSTAAVSSIGTTASASFQYLNLKLLSLSAPFELTPPPGFDSSKLPRLINTFALVHFIKKKLDGSKKYFDEALSAGEEGKEKVRKEFHVFYLETAKRFEQQFPNTNFNSDYHIGWELSCPFNLSVRTTASASSTSTLAATPASASSASIDLHYSSCIPTLPTSASVPTRDSSPLTCGLAASYGLSNPPQAKSSDFPPVFEQIVESEYLRLMEQLSPNQMSAILSGGETEEKRRIALKKDYDEYWIAAMETFREATAMVRAEGAAYGMEGKIRIDEMEQGPAPLQLRQFRIVLFGAFNELDSCNWTAANNVMADGAGGKENGTDQAAASEMEQAATSTVATASPPTAAPLVLPPVPVAAPASTPAAASTVPDTATLAPPSAAAPITVSPPVASKPSPAVPAAAPKTSAPAPTLDPAAASPTVTAPVPLVPLCPPSGPIPSASFTSLERSVPIPPSSFSVRPIPFIPSTLEPPINKHLIPAIPDGPEPYSIRPFISDTVPSRFSKDIGSEFFRLSKLQYPREMYEGILAVEEGDKRRKEIEENYLEYATTSIKRYRAVEADLMNQAKIWGLNSVETEYVGLDAKTNAYIIRLVRKPAPLPSIDSPHPKSTSTLPATKSTSTDPIKPTSTDPIKPSIVESSLKPGLVPNFAGKGIPKELSGKGKGKKAEEDEDEDEDENEDEDEDGEDEGEDGEDAEEDGDSETEYGQFDLCVSCVTAISSSDPHAGFPSFKHTHDSYCTMIIKPLTKSEEKRKEKCLKCHNVLTARNHLLRCDSSSCKFRICASCIIEEFGSRKFTEATNLSPKDPDLVDRNAFKTRSMKPVAFQIELHKTDQNELSHKHVLQLAYFEKSDEVICDKCDKSSKKGYCWMFHCACEYSVTYMSDKAIKDGNLQWEVTRDDDDKSKPSKSTSASKTATKTSSDSTSSSTPKPAAAKTSTAAAQSDSQVHEAEMEEEVESSSTSSSSKSSSKSSDSEKPPPEFGLSSRSREKRVDATMLLGLGYSQKIVDHPKVKHHLSLRSAWNSEEEDYNDALFALVDEAKGDVEEEDEEEFDEEGPKVKAEKKEKKKKGGSGGKPKAKAKSGGSGGGAGKKEKTEEKAGKKEKMEEKAGSGGDKDSKKKGGGGSASGVKRSLAPVNQGAAGSESHKKSKSKPDSDSEDSPPRISTNPADAAVWKSIKQLMKLTEVEQIESGAYTVRPSLASDAKASEKQKSDKHIRNSLNTNPLLNAKQIQRFEAHIQQWLDYPGVELKEDEKVEGVEQVDPAASRGKEELSPYK